MIDSTSRTTAPSHDLVVMANRTRAVVWAAFFGVFTAVAVIRGITSHSIAELVLAVVFFGGPLALFAYWAGRRRPALVISAKAFIDGRSGRVVPWDSVIDARVRRQRGLFGEAHHLVLTLANPGAASRRFITTNANNPDEIDINLDLLSVPWDEVGQAVETVSGYSISTVRD